jgi:ATP-binding cassette subfamily C exporter for protease/lipase
MSAFRRRRWAEAQKLAMAANAQANNHLRNAEVIEAMGMLPAIRGRWFKLHREVPDAAGRGERSRRRAERLDPLRAHLDAVAGAGLWRAAGDQWRDDPGMMIAGSILVGRALAPVEVLIANWKQLVSARAAYQRLTELLRVYPARVAGMPLPRPLGDVLVESAATAAPGSKILILGTSTSA